MDAAKAKPIGTQKVPPPPERRQSAIQLRPRPPQLPQPIQSAGAHSEMLRRPSSDRPPELPRLSDATGYSEISEDWDALDQPIARRRRGGEHEGGNEGDASSSSQERQ